MTTHPATAQASNLEGAAWFKSSYSNGGGACIEAADLRQSPYNAVAVRDSKVPDGAALLLSSAQFSTFLAAVRNGRFDR